ncbi:di-heme oxidoredictase family protein [Neorhodopirellula pilleata]|uniref:Cytochrome c domain-containing protein n=1 Tax=Neorhodopirellula pilleata TaxID=2714738 RepID=A0A5C6APT2_9BACT|nr:di-heme oxidoredictase family protein [Neorhodopirellula pilleata]TWU01537.1 hypothetical protein Pla100_12720 [Neorhodopirellula pilleata]
MRFTKYGRRGVAAILTIFAFALSATAQTESFSPPDSNDPEDKSPVAKELLVATRTGAELFEHRWQPTEPSKIGQLVSGSIRTIQGDVSANALSSDARINPTPPRQPTRMELTAARLASIEARRMALQPGASGNSLIPMIQDRVGDGLGPLHNATSCADCHRNGGGSGVEHNVTLITIDPRSLALEEINKEHGQQLLDLFPSLLNERGTLSIETVVHDHSTREGYDEIRNRLSSYVPGGIDRNWFEPNNRTSEAIASQPVVAGRHGDIDFYLSQRNAPPLFGLGLIDRISPNRLATLAEKQAEESGGEISGRVVMKFGWRGQVGSVSAFVSQACAGELGLTQVTTPQPGDPVNLTYQPPGIDMSSQDVMRLTAHVASISSPIETTPAGHTSQQVFQGESTFNSIGCASCHVPDVYPALDVFSDLLLHDMGEALQAPSPAPVGSLLSVAMSRPQPYPVQGPISGTTPAYYSGSSSQTLPQAEAIKAPEQPQFPRGPRPTSVKSKAGYSHSVADNNGRSHFATWDELQREWRTPPLWGIADTAPYLHDGRASTLDEAIRWHGGEAKSSRDRFVALSEPDKKNLLAFLLSLRAPEEADSSNE